MVIWTESWRIAVSIFNIKNANVPSYGNESSTTACLKLKGLLKVLNSISLSLVSHNLP